MFSIILKLPHLSERRAFGSTTELEQFLRVKRTQEDLCISFALTLVPKLI